MFKLKDLNIIYKTYLNKLISAKYKKNKYPSKFFP